MKILISVFILLNFAYAADLKDNERGMAIGEGFGFGMGLKGKYYNLSKTEVKIFCIDLAKKGRIALRSDQHFNIVVEKCEEIYFK